MSPTPRTWVYASTAPHICTPEAPLVPCRGTQRPQLVCSLLSTAYLPPQPQVCQHPPRTAWFFHPHQAGEFAHLPDVEKWASYRSWLPPRPLLAMASGSSHSRCPRLPTGPVTLAFSDFLRIQSCGEPANDRAFLREETACGLWVPGSPESAPVQSCSTENQLVIEQVCFMLTQDGVLARERNRWDPWDPNQLCFTA